MKAKFNFKMLGALSILAFSSVASMAQNVFPSSGNVGVGTTTPGYPLEVVSHNDYYVAKFSRGTGGSADQSALVDIQNGGGTLWRLSVGGTGNGLGLNAGQFYLERAGAGALMTITASGNTGIGTTTPSYPLHVKSNITRSLFVEGTDPNWAGMYTFANTTTGQAYYGYTNANSKSAWHYLSAAGDWALTVNGTNRLLVNGTTGNLLINKTTQTNTVYKLDVNGSVRANEVVVNTSGADFVFEDKYKLRPLNEVESYIKENKHLPEVPSAKEMQEEGMKVSELSTTLLQKVEELTLYVIELKKQNEQLQKENEMIKARVTAVEQK